METTCTSTPCASMSPIRSSGVKRTFGEVNGMRLSLPMKLPTPSPGSCRKPYHSRPASAARHAERGTRCAWMSMLFMRRALHGLLDPLRHHLGREGSSPVGVARQYGVDAAPTVMGAGDAARRAAVADRLQRLQQQTPRLDHRLVGGTEVLASAIDDAAHALL